MCVISALLVVILLFSSSPTRVMLPVFFQLQPSLKGYGDSLRPNPISRLHISADASAKFLLKEVEQLNRSTRMKPKVRVLKVTLSSES